MVKVNLLKREFRIATFVYYRGDCLNSLLAFLIILALGLTPDLHKSAFSQNISGQQIVTNMDISDKATQVEKILQYFATPQGTAAIIAATATVAAAIIAALTNWLIRNRQEFIEVSKYRMESISKTRAYYSQLIRYYSTVASLLGHAIEYGRNRVDSTLLLYYICCILYLHKRSLEQVGELQLASLDGEKFVSAFSRGFTNVLARNVPFNHYEMYSLSALVEEDNTTSTNSEKSKFVQPDKFKDKVLNSEVNKKFQNWFLDVSKDINGLEKNSRYYSELLNLEFTYLFQRWYGEEPSLQDLT